MFADETSQFHTAAYVAEVPQDNLPAVRSLLEEWEKAGATDREGYYLREINDAVYLFQYCEYGSQEVAPAIASGLEGLIRPLPVARDNNRVIEPMERVFYEAGAAAKEPEAEVTRIAILTGLKRDKEKDYRLLHDNPWPDVLAAIRRANQRHFSIFLEEIDGKLFLFGWLEYVGSDPEADSAANKKDPASIRWWKETDACQISPHDAEGGMWVGLEELAFAGE